MAATRTQVYLTSDQRTQLDRISAERGVALAQLVREAIDAYLEQKQGHDLEAVLASTFGTMPALEVPSRDEWDHGRPAN